MLPCPVAHSTRQGDTFRIMPAEPLHLHVQTRPLRKVPSREDQIHSDHRVWRYRGPGALKVRLPKSRDCDHNLATGNQGSR